MALQTNMTEWAQNLMRKNMRAAIPIMTHPGIEMLGKKVIDAVTDGTVHYQAIAALASKYPTSAATIIMDLTVESEAFGSKISFGEHEVPSVMEQLVNDYESVKNLEVPDMSKGRINEYLKASRLASENITDRPVFGGCIGPFSLAGRLFDMTEIMTAAIIEPETITLLLEKCTRFLLQYMLEMKKTGINGIIIAEPAAGLLDEAMCEEFSSKYVKQLVEATQDENFMVILHNCGNTGHLTQSMVNTGARGLHFGNRIDILKVLREVPSSILVMGNLDPVEVFKMSDAKQIKALTNELLNATKDYSNFVISSGCDTPPGVPQANVDAFFEAVNNYNYNNITSKQLTR